MTPIRDLTPFRPHPLVRGGHLQTIIGYYLPGPKALTHTRLHRVAVPDGDHLVVCENRASRRASFPAVVLLMHGLGGEANSPYMVRIGQAFLERGWTVVRMNHRGAGEGKGLARQTYHSGRSEDISAVLQDIAARHAGVPVVAVGFSLSGNALLKLLGEGRDPIPDTLCGAVAVTPPIELSVCATALSRPGNRIYDLRFVRMLRAAMRERAATFPDFPRFDVPWYSTLRQFDEKVTAPLNQFDGAEDYYRKCSAKQFLPNITVPTFLLASDDDPFIPVQSFENLPPNEAVHVMITRSGGHMGFVAADQTPLGHRRWLDYAVLKAAEGFLRRVGEQSEKGHPSPAEVGGRTRII